MYLPTAVNNMTERLRESGILVLNYQYSYQYYIQKILTVLDPPVSPELPVHLPLTYPEDPDSPGSSC